MNTSTKFLRNFFMAAGVIWVLSAFSILLFKLTFGPTEIMISLILPLSYAIVRKLEKPAPKPLSDINAAD